MTKKRYYAHKHLLQENKVHDKICHNFMNIDETVEHMNNQYWEYKQLKEENEQLKQQLKSIENNFKFSCTENRIEFNKDKIKVKDTHTELILKDGKLYISVFIPQINECFNFFYLVTERRLDRELINYDGDME